MALELCLNDTVTNEKADRLLAGSIIRNFLTAGAPHCPPCSHSHALSHWATLLGRHTKVLCRPDCGGCSEKGNWNSLPHAPPASRTQGPAVCPRRFRHPQPFTRVLFHSGDTVGLPRPPRSERVVTTTGGALGRWYSAVDPEGQPHPRSGTSHAVRAQ